MYGIGAASVLRMHVARRASVVLLSNGPEREEHRAEMIILRYSEDILFWRWIVL